MPSRFPGMDPYIEGQVWADFHDSMIIEMKTALVPQIRPRYVALAGERTCFDYAPDSSSPQAMPVEVLLPIPERARESYLGVRRRETRELVTVIEFLSPADKYVSAAGRREYLRRREALLRSSINLVEIDLLRDGGRLPMGHSLPPADYYVIGSRARRRPLADVWTIGLRDPLPTIPVPLAGSDPDACLDLQAVFASVYDRAGYDYTLGYRQPIEPLLSDEDAAWAQSVLDGSSPP